MSSETDKVLPVPQVPKHWFVGNLPDINPEFLPSSIWRLQELYGPIYQLDFGGPKTIFVSCYDLAKDIIDDNTFEKSIGGAISQLRHLIKDGLFSAHPWEKNWFKAHRILMPVFGPLGVRNMFDQQLDIASQLILRWDRFGPDNEILTSDDFTRLAFDTIGLCAFNTRFNEFYMPHAHEFASKMADTLTEAGRRAMRTKAEAALRIQADRKFWSDIEYQHKLCDEIVAERIKHPKPEVNDLLNRMLYTKDPETGEGLDPENIRYQMTTFLIAGHETTSGTLGFLFYHLLKNPATYIKAQKEVDEVLGTEVLTVDHVQKFKYLEAAIKETLRLCSPLSFIPRRPKKPIVIGNEASGKYEMVPEIQCNINVHGLHRDPKVWGDDAEDFKPERMLDFKKIPQGAWLPFGSGMRACLGRIFAEQEMIINVALILQRFQVEMADPSYNLEYLVTGTIKPKNFKLKVRRRQGRSGMVGLAGGEHTKIVEHEATHEHASKPLLAIFGSNAGTCQAYAEQFLSQATKFGYQGQAKTMDKAVEDLPRDRPVAIITPSYEGRPADNARKFVAWLEANKDTEKLKGVKYFLFGVGNSEWPSTFHRVPKLVDDLMQKMGAERIVETCYIDVKSDTLGGFEDWLDKVWKVLGKGVDAAPESGLKATISKATTAQTLASFKDTTATVKKNEILADNSVGPVKMHMEVELPSDASYETGDYLAILPFNHRDDVRRVLSRFKLNPDDTLDITDTNKQFLKSANPFTVYDLLAARVELSTPITQRQLTRLAAVTEDAKEKADIEAMAGKDFDEVLKKRYSIIDVLDDHPSCQLDFSAYLDMLKPMTARQYSISSCMLEHSEGEEGPTASITYDVHETNAWSGHGRTFHGVASSYLADSKVGSSIRCTIRTTNAGFHLPKNDETPVIMVGAGTGMAPMRGFIQERALKAKASGKKPGPALFYFGCRDVNSDYIYKHELENWEKEGVISVRPCFSKHGPEGNSSKYTSDRMYAERDEVRDLFKKGGKIFVCGSANKIALSTADVCKKIYHEVYPDKSDAEVDQWLDDIKETRYVTDVFG